MRRATSIFLAGQITLACVWLTSATALDASPVPFAICVVDSETGRGVPLVELRTVDHVVYLTDSAGLVAVREPALVGQTAYFHVRSHGYEYPADGFGFRGKALRVVPGESVTLELKRTSVAERLYRVTGAGIYRDSVLLGREAPIERPLLNAQVTGSDSVNTVVYRGRVYWFWGDTNRLGYPLGAFHVPGATSLLPRDGGLPIERGVDLRYWTRDDGFVADTCRMPGDGPTWIDGVCVVRNAEGAEQLFAKYVKVRKVLEVYERGLVAWNDEQHRFDKVATFDFDAPAYPHGHALRHAVGATDYVYFGNPHPLVRVPATAEALADPSQSQYEAFTCLAAGCTLDRPSFDRNERGAVRWSWKHGAPAPRPDDLARWIERGLLSEDQAVLRLRDVETGEPVVAHAGSVAWNEFRRRFVMIFAQVGGTSYLGETWVAEAETPLGPWVYARKVVTHDKYSFYNPRHHPMFDEQGGRRIFFEGTYSMSFSGNDVPTPRYDYNQIMYALDLADPRLVLPVAVYEAEAGGEQALSVRPGDSNAKRIAFMSLDRPRAGVVAIVRRMEPDGRFELQCEASGDDNKPMRNVVFYALPADATTDRTTAPLFAWTHQTTGERQYALADDDLGDKYRRAEEPLCRVWRYPLASSIRFDQ